jgi:hypothetical protein
MEKLRYAFVEITFWKNVQSIREGISISRDEN